ncbi:immunoglobulin superfamily member 1-like [Erythrolamprus reginae]|uniref:immunoglobulin superfamily member 1-like n=1 Tax=Erythrolamprus reginae TaxID=121349 RepID=UPI00396CE30E
MRLIFNMFLGWWLTQHRWTAEGYHPPPSISVNPSNVVVVGENIVISCKKNRNRKGASDFYLWKNLYQKTYQSINSEDDEAEFTISNAQESAQGQYDCAYIYRNENSYSASVYVFVRRQLYPSPSISVIPNGLVVLGRKITIKCKQEYYNHVQIRTLQFTLFKKGFFNPPDSIISENKIAEFSTSRAQESDGGIYFCDCLHVYENKYSKFSNNIYINITDPKVKGPDIYMEPKGQHMFGTNVRIYCQGPEGGLNYSLYKSTDFVTSQRTKPNISLSEFFISGVSLEHLGNYSCCYQLKNKQFVFSKLSDPLQLRVRDTNLTKPSIQIINVVQDASEANVSIQCKAAEPDLIFALLKSGEQIDYKAAEPGEKAVNFSSQWMNLEQTQNYTCQYYSKSSPFVWSVPSNPLEPWKGEYLITLWTSVAVCLFFLIVVLLVIIFILYRKRKKGSVTKESNVPANMYLNSSKGETLDEVSYAAINHESLKIRPPTLYETTPESCVYASVYH